MEAELNDVRQRHVAEIQGLKEVCVWQCVVCCSVLQCVAVYCSMLQCIAVCCCVLWQNGMLCASATLLRSKASKSCVRIAVCCSVLQCVAVCCSVLRRVAGKTSKEVCVWLMCVCF